MTAPMATPGTASPVLDHIWTVLDAVADQAQADWTVELAPLLDRVRLGDLARRLAGAPAADGVSGEADIF